MYQDTVVEDKHLHNPVYLAGLFICVFLVSLYFDFSNGLVGELLTPVTGPTAESGFYGRFTSALFIAIAVTVNLFAISFLPFKVQVLIVWVELLIVFMAFFYSFDLSLEFIQEKIWFMISKGLATTLYISAVSIFFATILAIYLGMPQLGFVIDAVPAGILALSLCYGAYMTEIFRAGIQSINKGQWEGARALGFGFGEMMRRIILPQSIPLIVPPTGNQFIAMLKDSTLVSTIGVIELMFLARTLGNKTFNHMEMLITSTMLPVVPTLILILQS